jgi:hypothetical protein
MTKAYEFSEQYREDLVYNFSNLSITDIAQKQINYDKFLAEKLTLAKAKEEAAAKAKAESENQVNNLTSNEENNK